MWVRREETEEGVAMVEGKKKQKWKSGDLILNMSSKSLSAHEEEVLKLGIKFSPYPSTVNTFQCLKDIRSFNRRLRLKEFFLDSGTREEQPNWIKTKKASSRVLQVISG